MLETKGSNPSDGQVSKTEEVMDTVNAIAKSFGINDDRRADLVLYAARMTNYFSGHTEPRPGVYEELGIGETYSFLVKEGISPLLIEATRVLCIKVALDKIREKNVR